MTPDPLQRGSALGAALVATLVIVRGIFLAAFIPPLQGPDEPAHFDYVQRLAETGSRTDPACKVNYSEELRAAAHAMLQTTQLGQDNPAPSIDTVISVGRGRSRFTSGCGPAHTYPPVYYATAAVAYRLAGGGTLFERIFAVRLVSALWLTAAAIFAFLCALWFFGSATSALLVGLVYALQPMVAFLGSVVSPDAALFACSSAAFASVAAMHRKGPSLCRFAALACTTITGVLTKQTFLYVLPAIFAFAVAVNGARRPASWLRCALALSPAFATAVAWLLHAPQLASQFANHVQRQLSVAEFLGFALAPAHLEEVWLRWYWATWGWLDMPIASAYYRGLELSLALAIVGVILGWRTMQRPDRAMVVLGAASTLAFATGLLATEFFVFRASGSGFIQGRYILPLFTVHAIVLVIGLREFSTRTRSAMDAAWGFAALLGILNIASVLRAAGRYYA